MPETRNKAEVKPMLRRAVIAIVVHISVTILRVLHWTWRKDMREMAHLDALQARGVPIIVAFWHGSYVPLFVLLSGRRATVLVAAGFRGDVIAGICATFGYCPVLLGGPTGTSARAHLRRALDHAAPTAAVAIDGPLGPREVPKPGIVHLAGHLGYRIVPVSVRAAPSLVLSHRWDRMALPLPFAKVAVHVSTPISVPQRVGAAALTSLQDAIGKALGSGDADRVALLNP